MRAFYQLTISDEKLEMKNEVLEEKALELFDQFWIPIGYENKKDKEESYTKGQSWVARYVREHFDPNEEVVDLEKPFSIKITEDLRLDGRIDRVSRRSNGTLEILDYKTGQAKDTKTLEKDLQLAMYAMAAVNTSVYGQPIDKLSLAFYYFETNEKIAVEISPERLEEAKQEILHIRDEIESSDFSCSNHYICQNGCEYDLFCNRG